MKIRYLTWKEFDIAVNKIVKHFEGYPIKSIYGEPRGGLTLAVALSHRMKAPLVFTKHIRENSLWVDDIIDSKRTYLANVDKFSYHTCWVARMNGNHYYNVETMQSDWIVFPWEDPDFAMTDYEQYQIQSK